MTSLNTGLPRPPPSSLPPGPPKLNTRLPQNSSPIVETSTPVLADFDDRPAKRRKVEGQSPSLSSPSIVKSLEPASEEDKDTNNSRYAKASWIAALRQQSSTKTETKDDTEPPRLPERPWGPEGLSDVKSSQPRDSCRRRADVPVPTSPDSIKAPTDRMLQNGKRPPGYFPWIGKHPEDVLNDSNVKQGYYDRPPNPPEKELNTAKAPLYNAFKHRSGLESLSALFSLVLEQKSKHGALSSSSSFKPPARVTLTEAKRKSWIADLANPDVPLRRLSRTIPQGVRGTLLLEQCLLNRVPLSRAIWFIKCVGANDIRTLKRKGITSAVAAGAETKWLKEWTTSIEQFLETVLDQCGQKNWQETVQYALRLCTRLYLENLLDRDHYLDWMIKCLDAANSNLLPFWLIVINLHKVDIVRFRKRGRRLASALAARYNQTSNSVGDALQPLADRLQATLRWVIANKPSSFLMPDAWPQCEQALLSCLHSDDPMELQVLNRIKESNQRAMANNSRSVVNGVCPEEAIISLLDRAHSPFDVQELSDSLRSACSDPSLLFNTCIEWCISKYRAQSARVYLVARLIRRWRKEGYDVDKAILQLLSTLQSPSGLNLSIFKHLFSELSRTKTFSVNRYMQWLTVQGMSSGSGENEKAFAESNDGLEKVGKLWIDVYALLREVCLVNAEEHVVNLRNNLLRKAGFDPEKEEAQLSTFKTTVLQILKEFDRNKTVDATDERLFDTLRTMTWGMRLDLSHWIRARIVEYAKTTSIEIPGKPPLPGARTFTFAHYVFVRHLMECIGDMPVFADILRLLATSKQESVLAAITDTVNYHSNAFSAIGAFEVLQTLLGQAYVSLRTVKPSILLFTASMLDLCIQYPNKITPVRALQQDFIKGDRGRAVAAYSPFSDTMAETLGQAGATFLDDFEAILQTETNMNEHIMVSLFTVLVERITKSENSNTDDEELIELCQLLARLKLYRKAQGETLIRNWLLRWISDSSTSHVDRMLSVLIATRCINIPALLDLADQAVAASTGRGHIHDFVRKAIYGSRKSLPQSEAMYCVLIGARQFAKADPGKALELLQAEPTSSAANIECCTAILTDCIMDSQRYATLSATVKEGLTQMIEQLFPVGPANTADIDSLVQQVNFLSLPFYKYRLRDVRSKSASQGEVGTTDEVAEAISRTLARQGESPSKWGTFQALLQAAGPEVCTRLREMTDQALVDTLPKFLQARFPGTPPLPTPEEKQQTSTVIEQAIILGPPSESHGSAFLIEKLSLLMRYFAGRAESSSVISNTVASSPIVPLTPTSSSTALTDERYREFLLGCIDYFSMFLQVACLKRPMYKGLSPTNNVTNFKQLQQEQIKLFAVIVGTAIQPALVQLANSVRDFDQRRKVQETIGFAFDVAATLVDDMGDESRLMCARVLKDKMKDERLRWLVGSVNMFGSAQSQEASHGLHMMHETKGMMGEFRPKVWEVLESGAGNESDTCLGLGMFGATRY